jgi:hypothetical protein
MPEPRNYSMKRTMGLFTPYLIWMLLYTSCQKTQPLYLESEQAMHKTITTEKNVMTTHYIYWGSSRIYQYPLSKDINTADVGYSLYLATDYSAHALLSVAISKTGTWILAGQDSFAVEGREGRIYSGSVRGKDLKTTPGDTLMFRIENVSPGILVIITSPDPKYASRINVK